MSKEGIFKQVYDDFFGNGKIERNNEKLKKEIIELTEDIENTPEINVKQNERIIEDTKISEKPQINKEELYKSLIEKVDNLYLEEDSKNTLKKILEYMKNYNEEKERAYIQFDIQILTNNNQTLKDIISILEDAGTKFEYLSKGSSNIYSMFDIDNSDDFDRIYDENTNIIALKDLEELQAKDYLTKIAYKIETQMDQNEKTITIISAKSKEGINTLLEANDTIKSKFSYFILVGKNPDVQDAYQDIVEKIERENKIENKFGDYKTFDDFKVKLLDYVSQTYPNNTLPYPEYIEDLCKKISFNKQIPEYEKDKTLDEIFSELNSLVGLQDVKKVLKELADLIELKTKAKDLKIKDVNLHMVFLGNPGTGKTTVARIVAEILYNLKYTKQNKLIEVTSKDLVGEYVGQTAPKTNVVIQKALGGVLFIDEAYSLASGHGQGNSYNEEAIATLIQAMENNRDNLVVIFAGYTKEMQYFLNANSGIVSRIGYILEFEDYTEKELLKIFEGMVKKAGFKITDEALDEVLKIIKEYKNTKNFGNARFVRNLYEKTVIKHASNTKNKKLKKDLITIEKDDMSTENLIKM